MPNATRSRRASKRGSTPDSDTPTPTPTPDNEETPTMTTATVDNDLDENENDDSPQFEIVDEEAPEDYAPDRKTPGRIRRPSQFDEILRRDDVFESGKWRRVPVSSEEHKAYVLRELSRSKLYLNKQVEDGVLEGPEIGLDLDDKKDDAVYYKSRTAQKRERKASADQAEANEGSLEGEEDEDEN